MSLINEALERARQEAIRRQAADRRVPPPPMPRSSSSERVWWKIAAGLMAATLVVSLVALALVLWGGRTGAEAVAAGAGAVATSPAEQPVAPQSGPNEPLPGGIPQRAGAGTTPVGAISEPAAEQPAPAGDAPGREVVQRSPAPTVAAPAKPVPTPLPAKPQTQLSDAESPTTAERRAVPSPELAPVGAAPGRVMDSRGGASGEAVATYVQHAELDDGTVLLLEGIAWSATGPFALLNGRVVGIREYVEGYAVVAISQEEIELEGETGRIIIRLK